MTLLGLGAALLTAAQVLYLTWPSTQGMVASAIAALLVWQLWSVRKHLNQHIDMIVLMTAYGGFGMLPLPGAPTCHISVQAFVIMNVGMLIVGIPAMLYGSRCMAQARRERRLVITLLADVVGMLAGMSAAHFTTPATTGLPLLHHATMMLGMLAGMGAARWLLGNLRAAPAPSNRRQSYVESDRADCNRFA